MNELFSEQGELKKVEMSSSHCDVTFYKKADALKAQSEYNGVTLDGREMIISVLKAATPKRGGGGGSGGSSGRDVKFTVTL